MLFTYRIVTKCVDIGIDGSLHIAGCNQGRGQIDVAIDEVGLQGDGMSVILQGFLKLSSFLVYIAQVRVRLGQHGILLNG